MWVTAKVLAVELGVSSKTIMEHVRKIESTGQQVRARIGKPAQINRDIFLEYVYGPGWRFEKGGNYGE